MFLKLFPGHSAVNVYDIAYGDWLSLATATDHHIAELTKRSRGRPRRR